MAYFEPRRLRPAVARHVSGVCRGSAGKSVRTVTEATAVPSVASRPMAIKYYAHFLVDEPEPARPAGISRRGRARRPAAAHRARACARLRTSSRATWAVTLREVKVLQWSRLH
ncbi:MAG: hypothetical protein MZV70_43065 [Desulfobacterales bacterium]|nr:hypothetical protein [Desulfobacterales bacterium]